MIEKPDGDPGFSAEKNMAIINETIRDNDKLQAKKEKQYSEMVEERADAASYFLQSLLKGGSKGNSPREAALAYYGKKELGRLRGEEIKRKLMSGQYSSADLGQ